jgi:undecaprenyl pyrophosphate phosphatase UppP
MLKQIMDHLDKKSLKEDFRKIGVNFITAGIIGVFVNHIVGTKISTMLYTLVWICICGIILLFIGLHKGRNS